MIQRIQTIYLFLVFIFALLSLTFPLASFMLEAQMTSIELFNFKQQEMSLFSNAPSFKMSLIALIAAIMILTITTTLKYKNRPLQMRLGRMNLLLHLVFVVIAFVFIDNAGKALETSIKYGPAIIFPLISMVLIFLANKAILKDEKLVKAADRLR